jgi:hypothetical protein
MTKLTKPMPRLPDGIDFSEKDDGNTLLMCMDLDSAAAYMHEDRAVFEPWALCANATGYGGVVLSGSKLPPPGEVGEAPKKHQYNRFLYRAQRFSEGFKWFTLSSPLSEMAAGFVGRELSGGDLLVNGPSCEAGPAPDSPGAKKECELVRPLHPLDVLLDKTKYHRQLPVGLFSKEVSDEAAIFPGDSSAIDIWSLSGDVFHSIELRVGKTQKLGVLADAFFHACFVRDMFCQLHLERKVPADQLNWRGYGELVEANIKSVVAHILTEGKHTWFDRAFGELKDCALDGMRFKNAMTLSEVEKRR